MLVILFSNFYYGTVVSELPAISNVERRGQAVLVRD